MIKYVNNNVIERFQYDKNIVIEKLKNFFNQPPWSDIVFEIKMLLIYSKQLIFKL